jgi:capsular polysaccharide biosynthesis protein
MKGTQKAIALSAAIFRRLLVLYPRRHREEFGEDMVQLFRDQCREAFGTGHWRRVAGFFSRTAWDLMRTSLMERAASLRTPLTMKPSLLPRIAAVLGGAAAFCVILGTVTVVLSLMPETYMSMTRIQLEMSANPGEPRSFDPFYFQTQVERLVSKAVLYPVIETLDLNKRWSPQHLRQGTLQTAETYMILRDRIEIRPVRLTRLLEVLVFDSDKDTAAQIANKVVEVYREQTLRENPEAGGRVMIVDKAEPGLKAVRPNWPMGLSIGALAACFVAAITTGGLWWLARRLAPAR